MDSKDQPVYDTIEEANDVNAEEALTEYKVQGYTNRRCLRCGGKYVFYIHPSGYMITCENGDYKLTCRGI